MKKLIYLLIFLLPFSLIAQESMNDISPYYEIPEAPEAYTAANVASRMIDGLGFRYYWVTDSLRPEDLSYKPSEDGRTTDETIDHIYELSMIIYNTVMEIPNVKEQEEELSFEEKRTKTLHYLYDASMHLRKNAVLDDLNIVFERNGSVSEYPFWNLINGPIADAIWHTGQVVSFRRSSGNPFNSKASVFTGKLRP
jgi:hypothetical protein